MGRTKAFIFLAVIFLLVAGGYVVWSIGLSKASSAWESIQLGSADIPMTDSSQPVSTGQSAPQIPTAMLTLPVTFTCQGQDISPSLSFNNVPPNSVSLAVDMVDTSGIFAAVQTHWMIWNISPEALQLPENANNSFGVIGTNDGGKQAYSGPCQTTTGIKHYRFEIYALDTVLNLPPTANYSTFQKAISNHVLGYGSLTVSYDRANNPTSP
jgi:hypothetical protein